MSHYIDHKFFYGAKYTKYNLSWIIEEFLAKASKKILKKRFNMFISEEMQEYLERISIKEKTTMSEYIRRLVDEDYSQKKKSKSM